MLDKSIFLLDKGKKEMLGFRPSDFLFWRGITQAYNLRTANGLWFPASFFLRPNSETINMNIPHTKIPNDFIDNLFKIRIPGEAVQLLFAIVRKTWGWSKKWDMVSLSILAKMTGLKKPSIIRAEKKLVEMNVISISKKANEIAKSYCINANYSQWKPLAKKLIVSKKANLPLAKKLPTKEIKALKETITPLPPFRGGVELNASKKDKQEKIANRLAEFNLFWSLYPRKRGKAQAEKTWLKLVPKKVTSERLMILLEEDIPEFEKRDKIKIPHPSTWLNQRYLDTPEVKKTNNAVIKTKIIFKCDEENKDRLIGSDGWIYDKKTKRKIRNGGVPIKVSRELILKMFGGDNNGSNL